MEGKASKVDRDLLPIKAIYFLNIAITHTFGMYLSVIGRSLSIPASIVGYILMTTSFLTIFSRIGFGAFVDRYQWLKYTILFTISITVMSTFSLAFVPPPSDTLSINSHLTLTENKVSLTYPDGDVSCVDKRSRDTATCSVHFCNCNSTDNAFLKNICTDINTKHLEFASFEHKSNISLELSTEVHQEVLHCVSSCSVQLQPCFKLKAYLNSITVQVGAFAALVIVYSIHSTATEALVNVVCFRRLGKRGYLFGKQMMFANFGKGVYSPLIGLLIDNVVLFVGSASSSTGLIFICSIYSISLVLFCSMKIPNDKASLSVFKDVRKCLSSWRVILYLCDTFIMGLCCAIKWTYSYWYLQTLGAGKLLMGLNGSVSCFLGSVPFSFITPYLIAKFGYVILFKFSMFAMFLLLMLYSIISNPWWSLLIEPLSGPSVSIFYSCMAPCANQVAPASVKATMQSLSLTAFRSIGFGVGALLGGMCIQTLGDRFAFRILSLIPLIWCLASSGLYYGMEMYEEKKKEYLKSDLQQNGTVENTEPLMKGPEAQTESTHRAADTELT